ncbi:MAG: hypothetical protein OXE54_05970 [Gammaproteobacteria bacterium]|nr:hypothetical protein [Gammaproteobacteria bacterium]
MRLPLSLAPALLLGWVPLAAQDPGMDSAEVGRALEELALYQADLHRFEADGVYHGPQLVEPLSRIADRYMDLNRFAEANATLDRAQQIVRIEEGLFTKSQLPFLHRKIENHVNSGNWREARKLQDHIIWFYLNKYSWPDQNMMRGMLELSQLHLRGITEDDEENRGYHYLRAAYSSRIALRVADNIWPRHEQRKAGLIYEQLRIMYLQASAINKGGSTGQSLRTSESRPLSSNGYLAERVVPPESAVEQLRIGGQRYLGRIERIYAGEDKSENAEALAMVRLYDADWRLLFDQKRQALEAYREAHEMLLGAGVPRDRVDELFATPALIPMPQFHDSVEKALAARERAPIDAPAAFGEGIPVKIFFDRERSGPPPPDGAPPALPARSLGLPAETLGLNEGDDWQVVALFSFHLPAAEDIETRAGWRRRNALGVAQDLQLIELEDYPVYREPEPLIRNLSRLRFRPGLTAGEPHAATGVISYLAAAEASR